MFGDNYFLIFNTSITFKYNFTNNIYQTVK